jgi:integrase
MRPLVKIKASEPSKPSVASLTMVLDDYLNDGERGSGCKGNYRGNIAGLVKLVGDKPIAKVSLVDAQRWRKSIAGKKGSTINTKLNQMRALWKWAGQRGLVVSNPFKMVSLAEETCRTETCTAREFSAILRHLTLPYRQAVVFLRLVGCRPQDVVNARWDCWNGDVITYDKHKTAAKTGQSRADASQILCVSCT